MRGIMSTSETKVVFSFMCSPCAIIEIVGSNGLTPQQALAPLCRAIELFQAGCLPVVRDGRASAGPIDIKRFLKQVYHSHILQANSGISHDPAGPFDMPELACMMFQDLHALQLHALHTFPSCCICLIAALMLLSNGIRNLHAAAMHP